VLIPRVLFAPHLPTLVLDEHRGHHTAMLQALRDAGERLRAEAPEAVVIVSGRWSTAPFTMDVGRRHRTLTDYQGFGVELRYDCDGHPALARALVERGQKEKMRVGAGTRGVDSGVTVPLHFLIPRRDVPVVPISVSDQPRARCQAWGRVLRAALVARPERIAFVVGGVLSRNEHAWKLRRETPEAVAYDRRALDCLKRGEWDELWTAAPGVVRRVQPESGLRHLAILRGLIGSDRAGEVLAYEPGPGMGAALIEFDASPKTEAAADRAGEERSATS
jgi:aromatic ring-opening dioxygenase catalytic subunit (LigB family)